MINQYFDVENLRKIFKVDGRLKVPEFLRSEIVEKMYQACINDVPFSRQCVLNGKYHTTTQAELSAQSVLENQEISRLINEEASKGIGFLYDGYLKSRQLDSQINLSKGLKFLHHMFDYMESQEVLDLVKQITGDQKITGAESQYTRFTQGQFLTRHQDIVPNRGRLYAFVFSMAKDKDS